MSKYENKTIEQGSNLMKNKCSKNNNEKNTNCLKTSNSKIKTSKINKNPAPKNKAKHPPKNKITENDFMVIHHINCRSSIGKIEEIFQYIEQHNPDFLMMSESKLDESVSNSFCEPPGYRIIRKDRSEKFKRKYNMTGLGGGIAILHKKELNVEIFKKNVEETEEIMWIYVKGKKSFLLGLVYNTNYCELMKDKKGESIFEKHIKEVSLMGCNTYVLGDFNIDLQEKCSKTNKLKNVFKNYGFTELIKAPTRIDPVSGRKSALDHIWTNTTDIVSSGAVTGVSDHDGTFVKFSMEREKPKTEKITIRNFKNYNEDRFLEDLERNLELSKIKQFIDEKKTNEATNELIENIKITLDKHAPFIEIHPKDENKFIPWYNEELREKIKIKKELLKDSRTFGKEIFENRLKKLTNTINYLKKILKQKYILEELEKAGDDVKKTLENS